MFNIEVNGANIKAEDEVIRPIFTTLPDGFDTSKYSDISTYRINYLSDFKWDKKSLCELIPIITEDMLFVLRQNPSAFLDKGKLFVVGEGEDLVMFCNLLNIDRITPSQYLHVIDASKSASSDEDSESQRASDIDNDQDI